MTIIGMLASQARRARTFLADERGSATVEFVLMVPMFTGLLMLMTDATMLYLQNSKLMNVSRDTARIVSRYAMTAAEGQAYAVTAASNATAAATAQVTIANGFVTVVVSSKSQDSAPFGIISFVVGSTMSAATTNTMEPV